MTLAVSEVPARRGAAWLKEGFALFRARPAAWIGISVGWLAITMALALIPIIGGVLANFLQPAFFAGVMIAARKQLAGEGIDVPDLFSGFRRNLRQLVQIGAILLLGELAVFALMGLMGLPLFGEGNAAMTVQEFLTTLQDRVWILLLGLVLTAALKGAFWFAPGLLAFNDLTTGAAIRWSAYAALSNLGTMVAYGIALTAMVFVALLPWGLGLFVAVPVMLASNYIGYREVFGDSGTLPPERAP
jgi:uncharacterized membrane protein